MMWDDRFQSEDYAYGTKPNDFLRERVSAIPKGRILSLAEGEGRNAIFLAKQGYEVTAVDSSTVGIEKAKKLASKNKVNIDFIHADLAEFEIRASSWDGVISIFCPLPSEIRQDLYQKVAAGLKQGGVFLMEAYTPAQVLNNTGGGKDTALMQSIATVEAELKGVYFSHLIELEREIIEGAYHTGMSAVLQVIAIKT